MKTIKQLVKKYFTSFAYFYTYLRHRIFVMIGLSALIGVLDGLGLTMFLPLLQLADGSSEVSAESLGKMGELVTLLDHWGIDLNIRTALAIMFIFFVLKGIAYLYSLRYNVKILQYFVSTIRVKLTHLFTKYSFKAFVSADVGRVQNSMTNEVGRVAQSFQTYSQSIQQFIMVLVYLSFVFLVDWQFAILVCIGGGLSNLFFRHLFQKTKEESKALSKNNSSFHGLVIQYIANFKYLKATGYVRTYATKLIEQIKNIEYNNTKIGFLNAKISALREPLLIGVICIVILLQVEILNGSLAAILISLLFFYRALSSLMMFQNYYNNYLGVSGSLENIVDFEKQLLQNKEKSGKEIFANFQEKIVLQEVEFGYFEDNGILDKVSLEIPRNQTIAFVGESGSGKTTLVNLISGLFQPNKGTVLIDGKNAKDLDINSYQKRIGYIAQEPVIFNDSIRNNVSLWAEDNETTKKRFKDALKQASINEFVDGLPQKEETLLGNNGINLSGGQKQRISIARELYKDIDILILDEATSALDSETEKEIQKNIDAIQGKYTILIIAHRLSTIKNADQIFLMDKGEIIGQGNFKELVKSSEKFRRMVELQEV